MNAYLNESKNNNKKPRNRDFKIIILLTIIIGLIISFVTLRPFSKEVVNLDKFADYYTNDETNEDGYMLLTSNYYSKKIVYNIKEKTVEIQEKDKKEVFQMPVKNIYKVVSGDTLSGIAVKKGVALSVLRNNNPDITSNLKVGQKIIIPS
ncbi:MAG: LysM domain-containing protein, partial [Fusobacterium sp.]